MSATTVVASTERTNRGGLVVSLDFEKAFDRVDRTFLWALMGKLNPMVDKISTELQTISVT